MGDGYHRAEAYRRGGRMTIKARVRPGTREDAILDGLRGNRKHGLPMSEEDRAGAVRMLLLGEKFKAGLISQGEIARQVGISPSRVSDICKELTLQGRIVPPETRTDARGRTIRTTAIGRTRPAAEPVVAAASVAEEQEGEAQGAPTPVPPGRYRSLLGGAAGDALEGRPKPPPAPSAHHARLETLHQHAMHLGESGDRAWRRQVAGALRQAAEQLHPLEGTEHQPLSEAPLWRALHHYADAAKRWNKLRKEGATDEALREAIGREFGIEGSSTGPGIARESHKGGKSPSVVLDEGRKAVELSGAALLGAVRALLLIPKPKGGR